VQRSDWVLLCYRLPREPSTPRIALWRKLRQLGAAQLLDGLVALPADSRTREQLEWLADQVGEAGGAAEVWVAQPGAAAQERRLIERMRRRIADEYGAVAAAAAEALSEDLGRRKRTLARLRQEFRRVRRRDYFPPPEREQARAAVERLAESLKEVPA
jgi:hypothetical protein